MKTITAKALSKKIGIAYNTMMIHLSSFSAYSINAKSRYLFNYNYYFLQDLKNFYINRLTAHQNKYYKKYSKVIKNIDNLLLEFDKKIGK